MKTLVATIMVFATLSFISIPAQAGGLEDILDALGGAYGRDCHNYTNCKNQREKYERRYYNEYRSYKSHVEDVEEMEADIAALKDKVVRIELRAHGRAMTSKEKNEIDDLKYQIDRKEYKLERPLDRLEDMADDLADIEERYIAVGGKKNYLNRWALKKYNERLRSRRRIR